MPLPFHKQLRYERLKRGWSQADIAAKVNSDSKTVARWERGKGLPRPSYRQALCELFGKNAEQMGLIVPQTPVLPTSTAGLDPLPVLPDLERDSAFHSKAGHAYQHIEAVPPPTSPRTIQQRQEVVEAIYTLLLQPDTTALVLTGIGGIGKSTLAALVYRHALQHSQSGECPLRRPPLWLTLNEKVTMLDLAGTLLAASDAPLPDLEQRSPHAQVMALVQMASKEDAARLIILDQFEHMLDWRTGYALPERSGVGEWLDALNSQSSCCKFLLTSRPWPKGTRAYPCTYMQNYPVGGLRIAEGVALLRQQGVRTTQATELQIQAVVSQCDGHAFALTLLAALLGRNRSLTIALLRENPLYIPLWNGDIARNFLDHIYTQQLNELERTLLFAFSLYREPVPLEACLALTESNLRGAPVLIALEGLLTQHLLQSAAEATYRVHMLVAHYIREDSSDEGRQQAIRTAHARAAIYYLTRASTGDHLGQPQRTISDLQPLIEAAWHRCQAGLWAQAFELIQQEGLFPDLRRLGANAILSELYQLLFPLDKWQPAPAQEAEICEQFGRVSGTLGKKSAALEHYTHALQLYRNLGNRQGEGRALNHMASVQENLGHSALARELHTQALTIGSEISDRKAQADSLNGLGWIAHKQGQQEEALRYYHQSLRLYQLMGNRIGESDALHTIGLISQILGQRDQALQLVERALALRREVKDRAGEGRTLNNLGLIYAESGLQEQAYACYQASLLIRRETGDRNGEGVVLYNIGKLSFARCQYSLALACWLRAQAIFAEVQSASQDAAQAWIDRLHATLGKDPFLALLAKVEANLSTMLDQSIAPSPVSTSLLLPGRPEEDPHVHQRVDEHGPVPQAD